MPRMRREPRPITVNLFALILLAIAGLNLGSALFDLPAQEEALKALGLGLEWNRDWTIVASSAWFTVELIPIALIWLLGSKFARWLLVSMAIIKSILMFGNLPMLYAAPGLLAGNLLAMGAIALLFTRDANRWFETAPQTDPRDFD